MKDYYEDLWTRLSPRLDPPDFERRCRLLLDELREGDRMLDLGCGDGAFAELAAAHGAAVVAADVAPAALARVAARPAAIEPVLVPFDGPLPFGDGSFTLVWASEVIEHVADTANWLSEVRRVLAPGGAVVITTPAHGRLRLLVHGVERYSDPQGDHLHLYTARSLREVLAEFGFAEVEVAAASGPPLLRRTLFARAWR